jgi:hypothetical protein
MNGRVLFRGDDEERLLTHIDSAGPVFISHRHSDGQALAWQQARALRASGVPVWLNHDDLPPSDTKERLAEGHGLSGGVLVTGPLPPHESPVALVEVLRRARLGQEASSTGGVTELVAPRSAATRPWCASSCPPVPA